MSHRRPSPAGPSRRAFLRAAALSGVAASLPAAAAWAARPYAHPAVTDATTPDEALALLAEGNRRFVSGNVMAPHRNMARLREIAEVQRPFAAFLGCADSRVPIEIVFDQGFGDLFVTRIAGNVATPEDIASLEFGCAVAGAKVVYVLGHTRCGAVTATMQGGEVPGQISTLYRHIRPAVKAAGGSVDRAIVLNTKLQAELIAESSPVIAGLVRAGTVKVAAGVYDLATGRVSPVALDR